MKGWQAGNLPDAGCSYFVSPVSHVRYGNTSRDGGVTLLSQSGSGAWGR